MISCRCGRLYRIPSVPPIHCPCGFKLYADQQPSPFQGEVGFIVPVFMPIGGTESWHRSLLPRLRSVAGIVSLSTDQSTGLDDRLGCPYGVGMHAAIRLAHSCDKLVVWNVADQLPKILPKTSKPKVIAVSHTDDKNQWTERHLDKMAPLLDAAVVICEAARSTVPDGIPCYLIPNAPDPQRLKVHNVIEKPPRRLAVVCSRLAREKRLDVLCDVFRSHLRDWELWIVGQGETQTIGTEQLHSGGNVRILPATDTPGDYYSIADVVVSASATEGYGLASAEALLAGLPVVSTPVGLFADQPQLGTIVSHDATPEQWAEAIRTARPKPIDGLHRIEDWAASWQQLLDGLLSPKQMAQKKMAICRSNRCGKYRPESDACGILKDRGKHGAVTYLQRHPQTRCVDEVPQFGKDLFDAPGAME